jgi:hypothetical protein
VYSRATKDESRELYSKLRNEREKVTFSMMMKMNPEALTAVRKEFFMREDAVKLHEFMYIIEKHLSGKYTYIHIYIYIYMYIHIYAYTYICRYICIYLYSHMYIY